MDTHKNQFRQISIFEAQLHPSERAAYRQRMREEEKAGARNWKHESKSFGGNTIRITSPTRGNWIWTATSTSQCPHSRRSPESSIGRPRRSSTLGGVIVR